MTKGQRWASAACVAGAAAAVTVTWFLGHLHHSLPLGIVQEQAQSVGLHLHYDHGAVGLSGGEFRNITAKKGESAQVTLERVAVAVTPTALLAGRLHIPRINISGATVRIGPQPRTQKPEPTAPKPVSEQLRDAFTQLNELPFDLPIEVEEFRLENVRVIVLLGEDTIDAHIPQMRGAYGPQGIEFRWEAAPDLIRVKTEGPKLSSGEVVVGGDVQLDASPKQELGVKANLSVKAQDFNPTLARSFPLLRAEMTFAWGSQTPSLSLHEFSFLSDAINAQGALRLGLERAELGLTGEGNLDARRVLEFLPAPLRPLTLEQGLFAAQAEALTVSLDPIRPIRGNITLSGSLRGANLEHAPAKMRLSGATFEASVAASGQAQASLVLEDLHAAHSAGRAQWSHATFKLQTPPLTWQDSTPQWTGQLLGEGELKGLEASTPKGGIKSPTLAVTVKAPLPQLDAIHVAMALSPIALQHPSSRRWMPELPTSLTLEGSQLRWRDVPAEAALAKVRFEARSGPLAFDAQVDKDRETVRFDLEGNIPSLRILKPWVPLPKGLKVAWSSLGVTFESKGRLRLATGTVKQRSSLAVTGLKASLSGAPIRLSKATVDLESTGNTRKQTLDLTSKIRGARYGAIKLPGPVGASLAGSVHPGSTRANLRFATTGDGPRVDGSVALRRTPSQLRHTLELHVANLSALQPLVPQTGDLSLDLTPLALDVRSNGELRGRGVGGGAIKHWHKWKGTQLLTAKFRNLNATIAEAGATIPALDIELDARLDAGSRVATTSVDIPSVRWSHPDLGFSLAGIRQTTEWSSTGVPFPISSKGSVTMKKGTLAPVPDYPVTGARIAWNATAADAQTLRLTSISLANVGGGLAVDLSGVATEISSKTLQPGSLELQVEGKQELAPLAQRMGLGAAAGTIDWAFRVEGGRTQRALEATGSLSLDDVHVDVPEFELKVTGARGQLGARQRLQLGMDGAWRLALNQTPNPYSRSRFADLHPYLSGTRFLALDRVDLGGWVIGPIAGNARVEENLFSVDQLQAHWKGGEFSGQLLGNLAPGNRELDLRGNVTGVAPRQGGTPLSANAALTIFPDRLEVLGRTQVVRIDGSHLLQILDLLDPYHEDMRINRLRQALALGYPERVQLRFRHGMVSATVKLGGAAELVRLEELPGIPVAPLLRRFLPKMLQPGGPN